MNIEKLELAVKMLREVEAGTWSVTCEVLGGVEMETDIEGKGEFSLDSWVKPGKHCGFSACAVGHMMLDKRFNDMGLAPAVFGSCPVMVLDGDREADNPAGWTAVTAFFEIRRVIAEYFFSEDKYEGNATPAQVADRIEQFLNDHKAGTVQ